MASIISRAHRPGNAAGGGRGTKAPVMALRKVQASPSPPAPSPSVPAPAGSSAAAAIRSPASAPTFGSPQSASTGVAAVGGGDAQGSLLLGASAAATTPFGGQHQHALAIGIAGGAAAAFGGSSHGYGHGFSNSQSSAQPLPMGIGREAFGRDMLVAVGLLREAAGGRCSPPPQPLSPSPSHTMGAANHVQQSPLPPTPSLLTFAEGFSQSALARIGQPLDVSVVIVGGSGDGGGGAAAAAAGAGGSASSFANRHAIGAAQMHIYEAGAAAAVGAGGGLSKGHNAFLLESVGGLLVTPSPTTIPRTLSAQAGGGGSSSSGMGLFPADFASPPLTAVEARTAQFPPVLLSPAALLQLPEIGPNTTPSPAAIPTTGGTSTSNVSQKGGSSSPPAAMSHQQRLTPSNIVASGGGGQGQGGRGQAEAASSSPSATEGLFDGQQSATVVLQRPIIVPPALRPLVAARMAAHAAGLVGGTEGNDGSGPAAGNSAGGTATVSALTTPSLSSNNSMALALQGGGGGGGEGGATLQGLLAANASSHHIIGTDQSVHTRLATLREPFTPPSGGAAAAKSTVTNDDSEGGGTDRLFAAAVRLLEPLSGEGRGIEDELLLHDVPFFSSSAVKEGDGTVLPTVLFGGVRLPTVTLPRLASEGYIAVARLALQAAVPVSYGSEDCFSLALPQWSVVTVRGCTSIDVSSTRVKGADPTSAQSVAFATDVSGVGVDALPSSGHILFPIATLGMSRAANTSIVQRSVREARAAVGGGGSGLGVGNGPSAMASASSPFSLPSPPASALSVPPHAASSPLRRGLSASFPLPSFPSASAAASVSNTAALVQQQQQQPSVIARDLMAVAQRFVATEVDELSFDAFYRRADFPSSSLASPANAPTAASACDTVNVSAASNDHSHVHPSSAEQQHPHGHGGGVAGAPSSFPFLGTDPLMARNATTPPPQQEMGAADGSGSCHPLLASAAAGRGSGGVAMTSGGSAATAISAAYAEAARRFRLPALPPLPARCGAYFLPNGAVMGWGQEPEAPAALPAAVASSSAVGEAPQQEAQPQGISRAFPTVGLSHHRSTCASQRSSSGDDDEAPAVILRSVTMTPTALREPSSSSLAAAAASGGGSSSLFMLPAPTQATTAGGGRLLNSHQGFIGSGSASVTTATAMLSSGGGSAATMAPSGSTSAPVEAVGGASSFPFAPSAPIPSSMLLSAPPLRLFVSSDGHFGTLPTVIGAACTRTQLQSALAAAPAASSVATNTCEATSNNTSSRNSGTMRCSSHARGYLTNAVLSRVELWPLRGEGSPSVDVEAANSSSSSCVGSREVLHRNGELCAHVFFQLGRPLPGAGVGDGPYAGGGAAGAGQRSAAACPYASRQPLFGANNTSVVAASQHHNHSHNQQQRESAARTNSFDLFPLFHHFPFSGGAIPMFFQTLASLSLPPPRLALSNTHSGAYGSYSHGGIRLSVSYSDALLRHAASAVLPALSSMAATLVAPFHGRSFFWLGVATCNVCLPLVGALQRAPQQKASAAPTTKRDDGEAAGDSAHCTRVVFGARAAVGINGDGGNVTVEALYLLFRAHLGRPYFAESVALVAQMFSAAALWGDLFPTSAVEGMLSNACAISYHRRAREAQLLLAHLRAAAGHKETAVAEAMRREAARHLRRQVERSVEGPLSVVPSDSSALPQPPLQCAVCLLPCHGTVVTCVRCGHGGHREHMEAWRCGRGHTECPVGCGCLCVY